MKIEISDFYKEKGFNRAYVVINKEPRRVAILKGINGKSLTLSYAKYLYTSFYKVDIENGYEIDHINEDKMEDRIENLQLLKKADNIKKSHKRKEFIVCVCPVCKKEFLFEKRNLLSHPNPCCSRRCGGIKSHWK